MFDFAQLDREDVRIAIGVTIGVGIAGVLTAILDGAGQPLYALLFSPIAGLAALLFAALD